MPRHHRFRPHLPRSTTAAALGLALAVGTPAAALAQGPEARIGAHKGPRAGAFGKAKRGHFKRGKRGHFKILRMADELGLSDAQRAEIRSILHDARAQKEQLREQPREQRRQAFRDMHRELRDKIRGVLTPEQREQARELRRQRWKKHKERRLQRMAERLELSDDQVERIRAIQERAHEQKRALFDNNERGEQLRDEMRQLHERTRTDIKTVLTPEQREQMKQMRHKLKRRGKGRR